MCCDRLGSSPALLLLLLACPLMMVSVMRGGHGHGIHGAHHGGADDTPQKQASLDELEGVATSSTPRTSRSKTETGIGRLPPAERQPITPCLQVGPFISSCHSGERVHQPPVQRRRRRRARVLVRGDFVPDTIVARVGEPLRNRLPSTVPGGNPPRLAACHPSTDGLWQEQRELWIPSADTLTGYWCRVRCQTPATETRSRHLLEEV